MQRNRHCCGLRTRRIGHSNQRRRNIRRRGNCAEPRSRSNGDTHRERKPSDRRAACRSDRSLGNNGHSTPRPNDQPTTDGFRNPRVDRKIYLRRTVRSHLNDKRLDAAVRSRIIELNFNLYFGIGVAHIHHGHDLSCACRCGSRNWECPNRRYCCCSENCGEALLGVCATVTGLNLFGDHATDTSVDGCRNSFSKRDNCADINFDDTPTWNNHSLKLLWRSCSVFRIERDVNGGFTREWVEQRE
ncbi:unannotated protein [freshwater metagenome]|uniref:Unannotated protein n=1 Tax=freshwater metagenome TaxID=449393 RepID=A0A6J6HNH8_9ZZZZ